MDTALTTLAPLSDLIAQYEGRDKPQATEPGSDVDKQMFLQLLVAQIKNQDPLNPADSMEYVSQMAQFSSLEQMIAIRQGVEGVLEAMESDSASTVTNTEGPAPEAGDSREP
ncbi:MAG: hypothetical protein GY953_54170 [bacterium]|nr:hypothetical protein [bacterium]